MMGADESIEIRLVRIEEQLKAVKAKSDSTQGLVIGILVTTLGTFLAAGAGLIVYLVQKI